MKGFIVVLDDLDLAREGLSDMVFSLLDELHQPRLILVIGADLSTLERRIADSFAEERSGRRRLRSEERAEDMKMAHELLYKILPRVPGPHV